MFKVFLPVQGSLLPSCSSVISQPYLPARSLCQVCQGAPVHLQPQLRLLLHCPFVPRGPMQPQINPFFSLISLLNWPHLFSNNPTGTIPLPAALPSHVQPQLSVFPSKSANSSFFSPAGSEPHPRAAWCLFPSTCTPDSTRSFLHPTFPLSGSTSLSLHLNQLESLLSVLY